MAEESTIPKRKRGRPRRSTIYLAGQGASGHEADILSISGKLGSQIGAKLKQIRQMRGLTQQDLAQTTFSKSYVSAIEHGKIKPSLRALVYLAERLNVPIAHFLDEQADDSVVLSDNTSKSTVRYDSVFGLAKADRLAPDQPKLALQMLEEIDAAILSPNQQLRRLTLIAQTNISLEDGGAALSVINRGRALAQVIGNSEAEYRFDSMEAEIALKDGRTDAALALYRTLAQRVNDGSIADVSLRLAVLTALANLLNKIGQSAEAATYFKAALQEAQDTDSLSHFADALWQLGERRQQAGDVTRAAIYATRSLVLRDTADDICRVIDIYTGLAEISQQQGERDTARQHLEAALQVAEQLHNPGQCADSLRRLTRLLLSDEQADSATLQQARAYADRCREWAERGSDEETIGLAMAAQGMAQDALNDASFEQSYQQAIERLQRAAAITSLGDTLYEYAHILRRHGDNQRAGEYLQQAYLLQQH